MHVGWGGAKRDSNVDDDDAAAGSPLKMQVSRRGAITELICAANENRPYSKALNHGQAWQCLGQGRPHDAMLREEEINTYEYR